MLEPHHAFFRNTNSEYLQFIGCGTVPIYTANTVVQNRIRQEAGAVSNFLLNVTQISPYCHGIRRTKKLPDFSSYSDVYR